jgi:hypothetical protein
MSESSRKIYAVERVYLNGDSGGLEGCCGKGLKLFQNPMLVEPGLHDSKYPNPFLIH